MPSAAHTTVKEAWLSHYPGASSGMRAEGSLAQHFSRLLVCGRPPCVFSYDSHLELDDRFIAKELSRAELQAMETFAPAYFDYMSSAVVANVRSE